MVAHVFNPSARRQRLADLCAFKTSMVHLVSFRKIQPLQVSFSLGLSACFPSVCLGQLHVTQ